MGSSEPTQQAGSSHDPATSPSLPQDANEKKDDRPRDSKGWDGKLRLSKKDVSGDMAHLNIDSDAEVSEDELEGPPPEQLPADEDLLDDVGADEEEIDLVHMRVGDMASLRLERFGKLQVCVLV